MNIWTIGHSTRSIEEFLELLALNGIEVLADVRSYPGSRKFPQFNAENLSRSLVQSGIEYVHIRELGGRRKPIADSPNTVWRHLAFRSYADYMETPEFDEGIRRLLSIARDRRTAIMCSEAVWWRCHRSLISDHLKALGIIVRHITGPGPVSVHPYTSAAKIVDGKLTYGAA